MIIIINNVSIIILSGIIYMRITKIKIMNTVSNIFQNSLMNAKIKCKKCFFEGSNPNFWDGIINSACKCYSIYLVNNSRVAFVFKHFWQLRYTFKKNNYITHIFNNFARLGSNKIMFYKCLKQTEYSVRRKFRVPGYRFRS